MFKIVLFMLPMLSCIIEVFVASVDVAVTVADVFCCQLLLVLRVVVDHVYLGS